MSVAMLESHLSITKSVDDTCEGCDPAKHQWPNTNRNSSSTTGSSAANESQHSDRPSVSFKDVTDLSLIQVPSSISLTGENSSTLRRTHSFHSAVSTPVSHRRASTAWDFQEYPTDPDEYDLEDELGKGATATVYLAWCKPLQKEVAIKIVNLNDYTCNIEAMVNEVKVMKGQHHRAVLPLYATFLVDDQLWMVLPFVAGGSAHDILKRFKDGTGFTEHIIAVIMRDVLSALAYLHKDGIIHRDLKAANILIDTTGHVILADFGVTVQMDCNFSMERAACGNEGTLAYLSRTTFAGTPCWMAPEVMEEGISYDCAADIWSFGMTLLELATGQALYANLGLDQILMRTMNEDAPRLESSNRRQRFSEELKEVVGLCLQKDPLERPSAERLLKHKFFKSNSYDSQYLAEKLEIGKSAAMAYGVKRNPLTRARSSIAFIAHRIDDIAVRWAPFEVDVTDALAMIRIAARIPSFLPEDSQPMDLSLVTAGWGLAFVMLKRVGKGLAFFEGTGFVIGKSPNARREIEWSAPSYIEMTLRGIGPPFRDMRELDLVMVLPSKAVLAEMQQERFSVDVVAESMDGLDRPPGHNPLKSQSRLKSFGKIFSSKKSRTSGGSSPPSVGKLTHGWAVERGGDQPLLLPLRGAEIRRSTKMNSELYGQEPPPPSHIMNVRNCKRPPPFERLAKELDLLMEGAKSHEPVTDNFLKVAPYWFQ